MPDTEIATALANLTRLPASDVKRRGWRGVVRALLAEGPIVVTNHAQPEAVIVPTREYARLVAIERANEARLEAEVDALRRQYDERLAMLRQPDASDRLRAVMKKPAKLRNRARAGASY